MTSLSFRAINIPGDDFMNFYYVTGHGIGPGTVPTDLSVGESLEILKVVDFKQVFKTSRELTRDELDRYDIHRWCPKCERPYLLYPALSRDDNATHICPECGKNEALATFFQYGAWRM